MGGALTGMFKETFAFPLLFVHENRHNLSVCMHYGFCPHFMKFI
jgi:hypothetical protein